MGSVLKRQGYHALAYLAIGAVLWFATLRLSDDRGGMWGLTVFQWVALSWVLAGVHQGWVAFFWRTELHLGKIRAWMGGAGFLVYRIGFVVFGLSRLLCVILIARSTAGTAAIPRAVSLPIIGITAPFILWGVYSVAFYFGGNRAFGADHFDPSYRTRGLEMRGIFKYVPNTMYTVVLLLLYHPALYWQSALGLVAAGAHHAFVWCHYFCTEKPDMEEIYGG